MDICGFSARSNTFFYLVSTKNKYISVSQNIIQQSIDQHRITFANVLQIIYHQEATAGGQPHEHRYTDRDQLPARCLAPCSLLREAPKADTLHKADRHGCCSCRRHSWWTRSLTAVPHICKNLAERLREKCIQQVALQGGGSVMVWVSFRPSAVSHCTICRRIPSPRSRLQG